MHESADMLSSTILCSSQRLLNPFRGVVNIIRYRSAEAVTSDGIHLNSVIDEKGIDASFIQAARVEARMRRTQMQNVSPDEVMSTFYIELNPSPSE